MNREISTTGHGVAVAERPSADEIHVPHPSVWPVACGAGITLLAFGVLTHPVFSAVGVLVLARALAGWIGELRHE